jgi:hypothetical protein
VDRVATRIQERLDVAPVDRRASIEAVPVAERLARKIS